MSWMNMTWSNDDDNVEEQDKNQVTSSAYQISCILTNYISSEKKERIRFVASHLFFILYSKVQLFLTSIACDEKWENIQPLNLINMITYFAEFS